MISDFNIIPFLFSIISVPSIFSSKISTSKIYLLLFKNGISVEITYLSRVPDNIRNSVDRGVKEAYFLLSKKLKGMPDKIAVWCRGFEKPVHGNSADLAYAIELISLMLREGHIKSDLIPFIVCATGVINNTGEITEVKGIREKFISAAGICKDYDNAVIIIPKANFAEYKNLLENDEEFSSIMGITNARVIPVAYLNDLIKEFNIKAKETPVKTNYLPAFFALILIFLVAVLIYLKSTSNSNLTNNVQNPIASNTNNQTSTAALTEHSNNPTKIPTHSKITEAPNSVTEASNTITPTGKPKEPTVETPIVIVKDQPLVDSDLTITKTYPCANQEDIYTNAPIIKIYFNESELKKGATFDKISVIGDGLKVLNVELDQNLNAILINTLGKYNKKINVNIPDGAVTHNSGKSNQSYSYSFTPTQDPRLSFEIMSDNNLNGWVKYTSDTGVSTFSMGESTSEVHSGRYSAKITSTKETVSSYSYYFQNLKPNTNYRISGFIKTKDVQGAVGAVLAVVTDNEINSSKPISNNSNWRPETLEVNSTSSKKLTIQCKLDESKGTAWFDDISIEEIP